MYIPLITYVTYQFSLLYVLLHKKQLKTTCFIYSRQYEIRSISSSSLQQKSHNVPFENRTAVFPLYTRARVFPRVRPLRLSVLDGSSLSSLSQRVATTAGVFVAEGPARADSCCCCCSALYYGPSFERCASSSRKCALECSVELFEF